MNSGDPKGAAKFVEEWHEASRQHAAICYNIKGDHVMASPVVGRVLIEDKQAINVDLIDGLMANKEVIVSCGALYTP